LIIPRRRRVDPASAQHSGEQTNRGETKAARS
jgi:hypothetical protein